MSALSKILKDKAYDELDDLSKFLYPWTGSLFEEIAEAKDVVVTRADIDNAIDANRSLLPLARLKILSNLSCKSKVAYSLYSYPNVSGITLTPFMKPSDVVFTFSKKELTDEVYLGISQGIVSALFNNSASYGSQETYNAKELISIFEPKGWKYNSSNRRGAKQSEYVAIMKYLLQERRLKIRNSDLLIKIAQWSAEYNNTGNKAALANLLRLKIAMHEDQVIYSIEEVT